MRMAVVRKMVLRMLRRMKKRMLMLMVSSYLLSSPPLINVSSDALACLLSQI